MEAIPKVSRSVFFGWGNVTFPTERYHFSGKNTAVRFMQKIFHFFLTSSGSGIRMRGLQQGACYSSISKLLLSVWFTTHHTLGSEGDGGRFAQVPMSSFLDASHPYQIQTAAKI